MRATLDTSINTLTVVDLQTNASVVVNAFTGGHVDLRNGLIFSPGLGQEIPAQNGTYHITDNPNFRADHPDWFGLLRQDNRIDDYFSDNGNLRGGTRLHSGLKKLWLCDC